MRNYKKEVGSYGETIAAKYLQSLGYSILLRNFRCYFGEVDIVACKGAILSFIEVKSRYSIHYGRPRESVTCFKRNKIYRCAEYYIYKFSLNNYYVRFDIIEVFFNKNNYNYKINFLEDAFR